jgi:hypothetical protein
MATGVYFASVLPGQQILDRKEQSQLIDPSLVPPGFFSGAPPPPIGGDEPPADPETILRDMLDMAAEYLEVEPDEEDRLQMQKVTSLLQALLAQNQKAADQMMAGKIVPRALRHLGQG